ncbi:lamin tail domain-containing protein [Candidatus Saccharibacteria bacterium]|nr:lamin tail domain-containing protein [Candidatus Saccharibacteria bacterium]
MSELLPNPEGSDTGNEFIELHNADLANSFALENYSLRVGPNLDKEYQFPEGAVLQPGEYRAFYSDEVKFTLVNSASAVQLAYDGDAVGDIVRYASTEEGRSWSLLSDEWALGVPTPGAANEEYVVSPVTAVATQEETALKPCADNQYRSPETNRCRKIETAGSSLTPCGPGQERNSETNRCRTIAVEDSTPKPCAEGQERNPETNRCRKIVQMTTADHAVLAATEEKSSGLQWYAWAAMGGIVLAIIGYAVWEWRAELGQLARSLKARFVRRSE